MGVNISLEVMKVNICINIKTIRGKVGFTQKVLSQKIDVDRSTVAKWETGKSFPRIATLPKIAKALNCHVDDLYKSNLYN